MAIYEHGDGNGDRGKSKYSAVNSEDAPPGLGESAGQARTVEGEGPVDIGGCREAAAYTVIGMTVDLPNAA